MPTCPAGHDSPATDFCDVCGMRIGAPPAAASQAAGPAGSAPPSSPAAGSAPAGPLPEGPPEPCPQCGGTRSGRFCEVCGFDFASGTSARPASPSLASPAAVPSPAAPASAASPPTAPYPAQPWTAVVTADRAYFEVVVAAGGPDSAALQFPAYCPERRFRLAGREMRIGRRSASRGLEPEIDLTGPPADPGASHLHAVLIPDPDGGWAVLDPGSANGMQVNGRDIAPGVRIPLCDGDRICLGAWTVLTIQAPVPGPGPGSPA